MSISIIFQESPKTQADTAIAGVYKGNRLTPAAENLDQACGGIIQHYLENQKKFTGKKGQIASVAAPKDSGYARIMLMGLDDPAKLDKEACETIGGKLYTGLEAAGAVKSLLFVNEDQAREKINTTDMAVRIALGLNLRSYRFDKYKTKSPKNSNENNEDNNDNKSKPETVEIITEKAAAAGDLYDTDAKAAEGTFLARDLVNEPPNELYPESFAQIIKDELKPHGVDVEIFDEKKLQKLGFGALLAVGMGSFRPPRLVVMRWNGAGKKTGDDKGPLAFVGKGVTFDTGGISLKPGAGMDEMKLDMGGAATVVGLMKTLALRKAKTNVVGVVGLAENMPSERAYRPGDVVKSLSGKTIEILNTDAEGRLVLIDALTYVQKTYKPRLIIDLATLTGAMMMALGSEYCGSFVNNDDLWKQLDAASSDTGEKLWRMPLDEVFRKEMDSQIADLKNLGGRYAGACTAAGFLERFIEDETPWAHLDIAGTAWIKADKPTCPKPGTGFGVRVLDRFIAANYEDAA